MTIAQTIRNILRQFHTGEHSHHFWMKQYHSVAPMKEKKKKRKCFFFLKNNPQTFLSIAVQLQADTVSVGQICRFYRKPLGRPPYSRAPV